MKSIFISYAIMLLMCILAGSILALMIMCSVWWGFLLLLPLVWSWVPVVELKRRIPEHPDLSTILLVLSIAGLLVIVVSVTLLMRKEGFLSIMNIATAWLAFLMTAWFISFLPRDKKQGDWIITVYGKTILKNRRWIFRRFFVI